MEVSQQTYLLKELNAVDVDVEAVTEGQDKMGDILELFDTTVVLGDIDVRQFACKQKKSRRKRGIQRRQSKITLNRKEEAHKEVALNGAQHDKGSISSLLSGKLSHGYVPMTR